MERVKSFFNKFRFKGIFVITVVFAAMALVLFVELTGVQINYSTKKFDLLKKEQIVTRDEACQELDVTTLLLWDSSDKYSSESVGDIEMILKDMKVGHILWDMSEKELPSLDNIQIVVACIADFTIMGDQITTLCDWVYKGGDVMFPLTLEQNAYASSIKNKIGIIELNGHTVVDDIYVEDEFMVGAGRSYAVADYYESAITVRLFDDRTKVYARENDENGVPLVWEATYGKGRFVVDNFGICDKAFRGIYAATLSLLTDVFSYPVINGSTFYLDDFPSQIPGGTNQYIERDYNTTVRDFYLNIWWPDMMNLCDKYGIKYTGLAIACYDDLVDGSTDARTDKITFAQLGNMLLRKGGELGYHGYNHQPLALGNKNYKDLYDYITWTSYDAMKSAFKELEELCEEVFPDVKMRVYVPPSNLLSDEGREMLINEYPQIRTLSGIYLPDDVLDFALLQEFEVDKNGLVDQPRIVSGCDLDEFMELGAFSELNFHFVNDHFTHPDDALDPDRGGELGWAELERRFESYLDWLYGSAPTIRNMTGTELSAAVQRFAAVAPKQEIVGDTMLLSIENFYDDAQFMVRFNNGKKPDKVSGGKITHLTGNLYLLEANKEAVSIKLK